jgi:hypothetical protein
MDSHNNFSNFRDAVQHADPPIIPYLGVYLTDLTFIEDGNNNMLPVADGRTDIINFEVRGLMFLHAAAICGALSVAHGKLP